MPVRVPKLHAPKAEAVAITQVMQAHCLRCGHTWFPKGGKGLRPRKCPACDDPRWDRTYTVPAGWRIRRLLNAAQGSRGELRVEHRPEVDGEGRKVGGCDRPRGRWRSEERRICRTLDHWKVLRARVDVASGLLGWEEIRETEVEGDILRERGKRKDRLREEGRLRQAGRLMGQAGREG